MHSHTATITTPTNKTGYTNDAATTIQLNATAECTKCDQMAMREKAAKLIHRSNCEFYLHVCVVRFTLSSIFAPSHRIPNMAHCIRLRGSINQNLCSHGIILSISRELV
jgi:hypothetical protein